ncbi:hypothetical protein ACIRL2_28315 [Embleya sp. NPDC127516]|uniref:hypothetical protein n=1 Tax=Embleya sp. NPDC127516 TaxID=3363990 RepID=UPI0038248B45
MVITEDDVSTATLVAGMACPSWRRDLYLTLETPNNTAPLRNAIERAAATAAVSAAELRRIVETVVAEGHEDLGAGFLDNPSMSEAYLLQLCDRGVLIGALGHRTGPRSLLLRMCEVHRYPESILTVGLEFYRDPAVRPDEFAAFVRRYHDVPGGWLLRALAEIDPDSTRKQTAYEDILGAASTDLAWNAAAFHARHLANAEASDAVRLADFLDRHPHAHVLALVLESPVPDPARNELLEDRACASTDPHVADALRRREHRRLASSSSLDAEEAAILAAGDAPDVLVLLAANPRTPRPILRELSRRRASRGARAIRNAATDTLRRTARGEEPPAP